MTIYYATAERDPAPNEEEPRRYQLERVDDRYRWKWLNPPDPALEWTSVEGSTPGRAVLALARTWPDVSDVDCDWPIPTYRVVLEHGTLWAEGIRTQTRAERTWREVLELDPKARIIDEETGREPEWARGLR